MAYSTYINLKSADAEGTLSRVAAIHSLIPVEITESIINFLPCFIVK